MSFIRVSLRSNKFKIDINTAHLLSFNSGSVNGAEFGSDMTMVNGAVFLVNESPRQLRSFIKKAQGSLPAPAGS